MPIERFPAPSAGTDIHTPAASLPKDRARLLANLLVHRPGKVSLRGPLKGVGVAGVSQLWPSVNGALIALGTFTLGNNILVQRTMTATPEWAMIDTSTGAVTPVTTVANRTAMGNSTVLGAVAYATAASATGGILQWTGTAVTPTAVGNSPVNARAVTTHLRRLFVGGGSVPGTTTPNVPNALYWSDIEGPVSGTLAQWQDNVSGLVNKIPVGRDTEPIVALASLGRQLVIFKQSSIWVLLGDTTDTFTLREVSRVFGPGSSDGHCVRDGICYFVDNTGGRLVAFDGSSFDTLGDRCPTSLVMQSLRIVTLPNDYLLIGGQTSHDGPSSEAWLFHIPSGAWIALTTAASVIAENGLATPIENEFGGTFITDGRSVWLADAMTDESSRAADQQYSSTALAPSYAAVPARWTSRLSRLALPLARSRITRVMFDHKTSSASGSVAWAAALYDGADTLIGSTSLAGRTTPMSGEYVRQAQEFNVESDDISVDLTLTQASPTDLIEVAELHDVWVEHDGGQKQARV